jgi:hypothetical protein
MAEEQSLEDRLLRDIRNKIEREFGGRPIMGERYGSSIGLNGEHNDKPFGIMFFWQELGAVQIDIKMLKPEEYPEGWR